MADPYGIQDLMFPPQGAMPPAAQPSIADLFQQGGVSVTPGATGAESVRAGGNVPPSARQAQYEGLAGVDEVLSQALQDPRSDLGSILAATRMAEPYRQQVAGEAEAERKREFEAGAPGREMQAKIAGEQAAQPLALQRMAEQARLAQQGQQAQAQLEHRLALERLQDTPFATGILAGRTPRDLAAMRPEQRDALLNAVGIGGMTGWGQGIAALGTAAQMGTFGPPGSQESQNGVNYYMAIFAARMTGMPIENFYQETVDPKSLKRIGKFQPSGNMALKVGGVTPQVTPPAPGASTTAQPGFFYGGAGPPKQPHPMETLFGSPAE